MSGFLGAGKTTLLNEIIQQNPGTRFAIIENEFGEINIDQELIVRKDDCIVELSNGCICCTVNEELVESLLKLSADSYQFDHLLIETTGIAEPLGVAEAFLIYPKIQQKFAVNAIICIVDSEFVQDHLTETTEAARQIAAADLVIFNKADLVQEDYLKKVNKLIKDINPWADTLVTSQAKTDTKGLLNMQAFGAEHFWQLQEAMKEEHYHHHHHISTFSLRFEQDFDYRKFYQWASMLLTFQSGRIYRIKGFLFFKGEKKKMIFQSVKNRFLLTEDETAVAAADRISQLVFIGNELQKERLQRHLRQCLYRE